MKKRLFRSSKSKAKEQQQQQQNRKNTLNFFKKLINSTLAKT